jgi:hypothetical protein
LVLALCFVVERRSRHFFEIFSVVVGDSADSVEPADSDFSRKKRPLFLGKITETQSQKTKEGEF